MPLEFIKLPDELVEKKFPGKNRPKNVYGINDGSVTMGIETNKMVLDINDLPDFINGFKKNMLSSFPNSIVSFIETEEYSFGLIEFKSNSIDGSIYNLMAFTSVKGQLSMVTFNCKVENEKEWRDQFISILKNTSFG